MPANEPVVDLDARFSRDGATPTPWAEARQHLEDAEAFWLSTVRPDGRPHLIPALSVWVDDALCFCTGPDKRKAKNLTHNPHCILMTGCNRLDEGLHLVVEGDAVRVTVEASSGAPDVYESKYGSDWRFTVRDGAFYHSPESLGGTTRARPGCTRWRPGRRLVYPRPSPVRPAGASSGDEHPRQRAHGGPAARVPPNCERRGQAMAEKEPVAAQPLTEAATVTPWAEARRRLADADSYWLATVRPNGRPHVMPVLAVWLGCALCFSTSETSRKGQNLACSSYCVLTVGSHALPALHLVFEGDARKVTMRPRFTAWPMRTHPSTGGR